jgi:hypothetical protein
MTRGDNELTFMIVKFLFRLSFCFVLEFLEFL